MSNKIKRLLFVFVAILAGCAVSLAETALQVINTIFEISITGITVRGVLACVITVVRVLAAGTPR